MAKTADETWTAERLNSWWFEEWGSCGCGLPDDVAALVRDVLALIGDEDARGWKCEPEEQSDRWNGWHARVAALLPTPAVEYLVYYQFERCGLIEHGTAVPGWLTDKGRAVLDALIRFGVNHDNWIDDD